MTPFVMTRLLLKLAIIAVLAIVAIAFVVSLFRGRRQPEASSPGRIRRNRFSNTTVLALGILAGALIAGWLYIAYNAKSPGSTDTRQPEVTAMSGTNATNMTSAVAIAPASRVPGRWVWLGIASLVVLLLVCLSNAVFRRVNADER